jgi:hypothetical protein
MAKPIDLGLCIEGEDAKRFWENERSTPTDEQKKMFKEAKEMYKRIRF